MKWRKGFVSNSSSSSFILSVDSDIDDDTGLIVKIPFKDLKKIAEETDFEVVRSVDEYNKYFLDRYGWRDATLEEILEDEDYLKETYDKCIEELKNGKAVISTSIDYGSCETFSTIVNSCSSINVIEED